MTDYKLMQGNEACAQAAIAAGCRFFAGYPITPSSEIAEVLSRLLPQVGGRFIQMEDEIAGMAAIIGASLTGVKSMTATSGPGFSLKQENIGFASLTEVPTVVVNVQRMGPSTGMPTSPSQGDVMQARWGTHGDHPIVVLSPSSVRETYNLTVEAFNIAEELRLPVVLLMDEVVAHMREKVLLPEAEDIKVSNRPQPEPGADREGYLPYRHTEDCVPPMASFGHGYRHHVTGLFHDESGFPTNDHDEADQLMRRLYDKIERNRQRLQKLKEESIEDAEICVFAYGSTARSALRAVRDGRASGHKVGFISTATIWPFPDKAIAAVADRVQKIIVPEMNMGQLVREVQRHACGKAEVISLPKTNGQLLTPDEILGKIEEAL